MIRPYEPEELDQLLEVWLEAAMVAHSFLPREFFDQEREEIRQVHLPIAETWVFEDQGSVVGFISLLGDEIGGLFVGPRHQRKGIGRALVRHARASRGQLELEVLEANETGRAFYAAQGFVVTGGKVDDKTGCRVLRMRG